MNKEQSEFLLAFENIKVAYNIAMLEVNKLNKDIKPSRNDEEMATLREKCIRLIDSVFEIPLILPDNFDNIAEQWSDICMMVQHLTEIKTDILHKSHTGDQQVCGRTNKFLKGTLCTAAAVIAGGAVLGYMAPGFANCVANRVGCATMRLTRFLAPHGMTLLQKTLGCDTKNNENNSSSNSKLEGIVTLATGAISTVCALQKPVAIPEKTLDANKPKNCINFKEKKNDLLKIKKER